MSILELLQKDESVPVEMKPHELKGNYKNFMECHIENAVLLIWYDKVENVIKAVRKGSHSELFGKKK